MGDKTVETDTVKIDEMIIFLNASIRMNGN